MSLIFQAQTSRICIILLLLEKRFSKFHNKVIQLAEYDVQSDILKFIWEISNHNFLDLTELMFFAPAGLSILTHIIRNVFKEWSTPFTKITCHAKNEPYTLANFRWESAKTFFLKMETKCV